MTDGKRRDLVVFVLAGGHSDAVIDFQDVKNSAEQQVKVSLA